MLDAHRQELERQGYRVVAITPDGFVASRAKWYWDCVATKISTLVLMRQVADVDAATIRADLAALATNATRYDPSALPRGFQKGRALVAFYVADRASPDAIALATARPSVQLASFPLAGIVEGGRAHYYRETPIVGGLYFSKFRYLMSRLAEPAAAPTDEPLSVLGIALTSLMAALIVGPLCCGPLACIASMLASSH